MWLRQAGQVAEPSVGARWPEPGVLPGRTTDIPVRRRSNPTQHWRCQSHPHPLKLGSFSYHSLFEDAGTELALLAWERWFRRDWFRRGWFGESVRWTRLHFCRPDVRVF